MSTQHLEILDTAVHKTHQWLDSLAEAAHLDKHTALQALRSVLHTLRDRLPPEEAAQFAAQLPILVRGMFYEGYQPARTPLRLSKEEFLARVSAGIASNRSIAPTEITEHVFLLLERFLGAGELQKLGLVLPSDLCSLLPERNRAL